MPTPHRTRNRRRQRLVTATVLVAGIAASSVGVTALFAPAAEQSDVAELFPPDPRPGVDDGSRLSLTGRSEARLPVDAAVSTPLLTTPEQASPSAAPLFARLGRPWRPLRQWSPPTGPTITPTPQGTTPPPTGTPTTSPTAPPTSAPAPTTSPDPSVTPTPVRTTQPPQSPTPKTAPPTTTAPKPPTVTRPDDTSTGVPAGKKLKVHDGDLTVTERGAVIDGLDVRGAIKVRADDVTIKNTIVRGRPVSSILHLVQADGVTGTKIVDTEIFAEHPSPYVMGVLGSGFTLERVNIHTVIDQVTVLGDDVTIKSSWLHDNLFYANDPNHGGGPSHDDNIQVQVGSNLRVTGSRLEGSSSAAIMITQGRGKVSDMIVENSWIDGGSCSVNIAESKQGPLRGLTFRNNVFGTSTRHPYCALLVPPTTTVTQAGNAFVDGAAFRVSKG